MSITRIAGLTWKEWNARLAMPLVTLREGIEPLVFATDLSVDKQLILAGSKPVAGAGTVTTSASDAVDRKTPTNCISLKTEPGATSTPRNSSEKQHRIYPGGGKLKHLSEEEATALMLKAVAEKQAAVAAAAASGVSNNSTDMNYGDDNLGSSGGAGGNGNNSSDYPATLSGAVAFADVGGAAGLSHINILSTISAMNNLISGSSTGGGGGGGTSSGGSSSGGAGGGGSTGNLTVTLVPGGGNSNDGGGGGAGHPCPVCGRVYKLKSSLRNHQKWECGKEPQFQCPFCVYRAKQKMHIGRHMERMHKEKFKLEDDKSFIGSLAGIGGVGVAGVGGDNETGAGSTAAAVAAAAAAAAMASVPELHTHFS